MAIFYLLLLAITGCAVRAGSVFLVGNYGITAGLVALAMLFAFGRYLSLHHEL